MLPVESIEQSIKELAKRKLLLVDPSDRPRSEMARCLRGIGVDVHETASLSATVHELQDFTPDFITLDVDTPGGDLAKIIRTITEKRPTATAAFNRAYNPAVETTRTLIILTCSARTPRERLLSLITPAVAAVIVTPCRPEMMIQRLARALAAATSPATTEADRQRPTVLTVPGLNAILEHRVLCPFHDQPVESRRFALRVGKLETVPDFFDVPTYPRALPQADYLDYHRLAVTVCPDCLFASLDPASFILPPTHPTKNAPTSLPSPASAATPSAATKLTPAARYAIVSRAYQRRQFLGDLDPTFFTHDRSLNDAVRTYELALQCAHAIQSQTRNPASGELARLGNYHLRIAHVQQTLGSPPADRDAHIEHAAKLLKDAFATLPEPSVPRNVYQVVATSIYNGDDRDAHQYLSKLATFRKQSTNPALREQLDHYFTRSSQAWEDRDHHRRPTTPTTPLAPPLSPTTLTPATPIPFLHQAA